MKIIQTDWSLLNLMTTVYVGIVTYNSQQDIIECLSSLATQTFSNINITVLDNASHDMTIELVRAYHDQPINLLQNPTNVGFAQAHNQIISQCFFKANDFYLALNPDVQLTKNYIAEILAKMDISHIGWATGKLMQSTAEGIIYSTGHGLLRGGYFFNIGYDLKDIGLWEVTREIWGAPATALIIKATLIHSLQAIDCVYEETFFLYNEDTDFDWKARNLGWKCCYVPTAIAYHQGGTATANLKVLSIGNRYLSAIKNAPSRDVFLYILPMMSLHLIMRCVITPLRGIRLLLYVLKYTPRMIYKRRLIPPARGLYIAWTHQSKSEITAQPRTLSERFSVFIQQFFD